MAEPTSELPARRRLERALDHARERVGRGAGRALRAVRAWRPRHGWAAAVGLVVAGVLASLVFGVTTASVQASLGPHVTRYDVTTDSTVTIDFGPLGTLQIDSPLPATLGIRATVQEIPASVTELGQARTLQALSEDLNAYVSFFSGPAAAVQDVANALVADALLRSAVAFLVLLAAWLLLRWLLGPDRRHELGDRVAARSRPLVAGALAVVVGATVLTSSVAPRDRPASQPVASAVFAGTPLDGARVTGRLGGVIDTYGAYALDAWRANEDFYRSADDALAVAWADWEADEERLADEAAKEAAAPAATPGATPDGAAGEDVPLDAGAAGTDGPDGGLDMPGAETDPDGTADVPAQDSADAADAAAADAAAADDAGPSPTASASPTAEPDPPVEPIVLVVASDLHCNVGMAPLIGTLARLSGADAVLDAGDTTMNGTSVEQYCVTSFARAVPPGVALVTAPGNHDSRETTDHYARAGAIVLDGGVVEVAGLRILGDRDPNETRVGAGGTASAADETPTEAGRRLADVACDDGEVDLLLIHSPSVGDAALDDGCVAAQVSGHYHRRIGPEQVGRGVRYVSSSTAGATLNQPTVGPLKGVAELTVLRFDPESRRFLDYQVVRVAPDASVSVGRPQPWPVVVEERDAEDVVGFGPVLQDDPTAPEDGATPEG
ncbi:metallophosphoesterase family protein [Cellulomonas xiejunii]|uniref:Metallophosphoesterase n=1 Tax=Cellulomonas xiejunii TaxID=2968083 RepID=A0ABY5KIV5_9CELL|nr:metallophosphoesterase [Cellulomonas xiejunii]MCC2320096.1 metallophosphoesterase [Cellulomonas xiejunii]UUI70407.1 metallophosphoesterase [Cellulomonas xiejunii]